MGYKIRTNKTCWRIDRADPINTVEEAVLKCNENINCRVFHSTKCDKQSKYFLCKKGHDMLKASKDGDCAYVRGNFLSFYINMFLGNKQFSSAFIAPVDARGGLGVPLRLPDGP